MSSGTVEIKNAESRQSTVNLTPEKGKWCGRTISTKTYHAAGVVAGLCGLGCIVIALGCYFNVPVFDKIGMPTLQGIAFISQGAAMVACIDHFAHKKEQEREEREKDPRVIENRAKGYYFW